MKYTNLFVVIFFINISLLFSQEKKLIDGVIATVGEEIVLQSDVEEQISQLRMESSYIPSDYYCKVLDNILTQKLMVNQAELDSVEVSEDQVEMQLDQRINYFISGFGSEKKMEEYFGKSVSEIKQEMRPLIKDQMLAQQITSQITGDISTTPSEVKSFYKSLSSDSIPWVESKVKLAQIVVYPDLDENADYQIKQELLELRKRVIDGESFKTLAVLYSEGPSASKGGEIGFMAKGELAPEYAEAAFKLKTPGSVSNIVKTDFGYHIIQLIEKRDNKVNTRHILIKPKYNPESLNGAKQKLDSLLVLIRTNDSITFSIAAKLYSQDKETGINGGVIINPETNNAYFSFDDLDVYDYYAIKELKVGEISNVYESVDKTGKKLFKIVKVMEVIDPHKANLEQDFNLISEMLLVKEKEQAVEDWISDKISSTYIKINESYSSCSELSKWFLK